MTTLQLQSRVQTSAPLRFNAKSKPGLLPTGNIGSSAAAPALFAENGVIWASVSSNNNMYPVGFNSINAFQNWAYKISSGSAETFAPMDAAAYAKLAFSYLDFPGLRAGSPVPDTWLYACTPTLAPMLKTALTSLAAYPGANAGCALKSLGSVCTVLTASGKQTMSVAYLLLVPDTTRPYAQIWTEGCLW